MATSYHNLGILAQDRGDYDEAARQYQRALDINERLGNQAGMATSYRQLGILAQPAATTTKPNAATNEPSTSSSGSATRPSMATIYSNLGNLERGPWRCSCPQPTAWHVKALVIRLRLGVPQAESKSIALGRPYRRELGAGPLADC